MNETYKTPINGRYSNVCDGIMSILDEDNIIYTKVKVSMKWALFVYEQMTGDSSHRGFKLDSINRTVRQVKKLERNTKHDIAAIVSYLRSVLPNDVSRYVHAGLTSQDVVSVSTTILVKECVNAIDNMCSSLDNVIGKIDTSGYVIGRTHGQMGSPIKLSRLIGVYRTRLNRSVRLMVENSLYSRAKFSGSMGDMEYMKIQLSLPQSDCKNMVSEFMSMMGIAGYSDASFQTDWWHSLCNIFESIKRLSLVLKNISIDMWMYSSHNDLIRIPSDTEVGSSAMPHKVNPISFENAEGNCKMVIGLCDTFVNELSVSRMQRDLSDSTMIRNVYLVFCHLAIAIDSSIKGFNTHMFDTEKIKLDMISNPGVFSEHVYSMIRSLIITESVDTNVDIHQLVKKHFRQSNNNIDYILESLQSDFDDNVMSSDGMFSDISDSIKNMIYGDKTRNNKN